MTDSESRVLAGFRAQYTEMRTDLAAFTEWFDGVNFDGYTVDDIRDACTSWWEARLGGRLLDHGERRLRGTQGRN